MKRIVYFGMLVLGIIALVGCADGPGAPPKGTLGACQNVQEYEDGPGGAGIAEVEGYPYTVRCYID